MVKAHVGMLPTDPVISQYKEMCLLNPYRYSTRTYHIQRRYQSQLCKDKNYPRLKTTSEPKTGQSTVRTHRLL